MEKKNILLIVIYAFKLYRLEKNLKNKNGLLKH